MHYFQKKITTLPVFLRQSAAAILILISVFLLLPERAVAGGQTPPPLALKDRILRLHILAAGNDTASQELKLHVRDAVLSVVREPLTDVSTAAGAKAALLPLFDEITAAADRVLAGAGVSYRATVEITTEFFPIKQYGSLLLPPGEYQALRIVLGEGEGKNWWCMLYPSLCFTEGITASIAEDEKEELRGLLTEDEFDTLFSTEEKKPLFRFRLSGLLQKIKKFFS